MTSDMDSMRFSVPSPHLLSSQQSACIVCGRCLLRSPCSSPPPRVAPSAAGSRRPGAPPTTAAPFTSHLSP